MHAPASNIQVQPAAAPLDSDERLHVLDILRGFALFGMIVVHFHQNVSHAAAGVEDLIGWGVWLLVEQKAWGTFAFLFGAGFAVLLRRLESRHSAVVPVYLRRLATLALFGVIAEVCFGFRILFAYALWGVPLLLIRRWSTPTLLVIAALSACARPVFAELSALYAWWASNSIGPPAGAALRQAVDAASQLGDYTALLSARWSLFIGTLPRQLIPGVNLTLFILGLLAVRHRVIDEPLRHLRLIYGWMLYGALAWISSWLILRRIPELNVPGTRWPLEYGLGLVQEQWLCFTYIGAGLLLLAYRPQWTSRLAPFALAGRMALTNYLAQAAVLDVLSSSYGLGLALRPYAYLAAATLLFGFQAAASGAWLARYRFGPLEWFWRTLTYARAQPLSRARTARSQNPVGEIETTARR